MQDISTLPVPTAQDRISAIHEAGAARHKAEWFHANRRAVEVLWGTPKVSVTDPEVKRTIALIVLRVLDGQKADAGWSWNTATLRWEK